MRTVRLASSTPMRSGSPKKKQWQKANSEDTVSKGTFAPLMDGLPEEVLGLPTI